MLFSFEQGTYNKSTGMAGYTSKEWPYFIEKLTRLHKADTRQSFVCSKCFLCFIVIVFCRFCFLDVSAENDHL